MESKPEVVVVIANCGVKKKIVGKLDSKFDFATIVYHTVRIADGRRSSTGEIVTEGVL